VSKLRNAIVNAPLLWPRPPIW